MSDIVNVLHLSDLHFGVESQAVSPTAIAERKNTLDGLIKKLKRLDSEWKPDVVVISGDIGWKGIDTDYEMAQAWIENELLGSLKLNIEDLIICAGNHDIDRTKTIGMFPPPSPKDADEWLRVENLMNFIRPFETFNQFCERLKLPKLSVGNHSFHLTGCRDLNGMRFLVLNSAWFSRGDSDVHKLWIGWPQLQVMQSESQLIDPDRYDDDVITISILHHPPEWLHDAETNVHDKRVNTFRYLSEHSHLILCGHVHGAIETPDRKHNAAYLFKGGATYSGASYQNNFSIFKMDKNKRTVRRAEVDFDPRHDRWELKIRGEIGLTKQGGMSDSVNEANGDSRKSVNVEDSQIGILGKNISVEGGIHFHAPLRDKQNLAKEIREYCKKTESLHNEIKLAGFKTKLRVPILIEDIYVPLRAMLDLRITGHMCFGDSEHAEKHLQECGKGKEISLLEAFHEIQKLNRKGIVILGDPGSGKTTHLKRLLLWCLCGGLSQLGLPTDMIPVFLPLRELKNLSAGLSDFIQNQLNQRHLETPDGFGKSMLKRGNLLFLLDGLDEVAKPEHRIKVSRWIEDALTVYPDCRFVVTCRFAGYTAKVQLSAHFLEMHIRPLNEEEAETFIHNWYRIVETGLSTDKAQATILAEEAAENLIERLQQPEFRARRVFELTRNPLLLTNLCLVHRDRGGSLPKGRSKLYKECTEVLLELWRDAIGYKTRIDAQTGRRILQPAALWLHQKKDRTRASADELSAVIEPTLKPAGWKHGTAHDFLKIVCEDSGLLTGWGQDNYGFMHLSFQEYLAAREIRICAYEDKQVLTDLAAHFGESWWQEVTLILLALEEPSHFKAFMTEVIKQPSFTSNVNLVEMCFDDAAEISIHPFIDLVKQSPGSDPELHNRQLAALKLIQRWDSSELEQLIPYISNHPNDEIRNWLKQQADRKSQDVINASQGGYELVRIPAGSFMMGSEEYDDEKPVHEVHISEFYLGRYPVTNEEYERFMVANPGVREPDYWGDRQYNQPRQPVVGVDWDDAVKYAEWAGLQLPTEAQWEYACRAGTTTRYYTGDKEEDLDRAGWYDENSGDKLHPVGEKEPNKWGLYDMHGNVWEWCHDWYDENYYANSPSIDPAGPDTGLPSLYG